MENYLYHYCSIETLEAILRSKKIRFSSLDIVDDMEESLTSDYENIGKICFVSCWTDSEEESVEMWRTYTGGENGVRIGFPKDLFIRDVDDEKALKLNQKFRSENDIVISPPYMPELIPVTYTKDDTLINLEVTEESVERCNNCSNTTANLKLETKFLGRFKRNYWSGQSEWRYRLIAISQQYYRNHNEKKYLGNPAEKIELMRKDLLDLPFEDYIDFPFNEEVLKEMTVVLSPLNDKKDDSQVVDIIKNYTNEQDISIEKSTFRIRKK